MSDTVVLPVKADILPVKLVTPDCARIEPAPVRAEDIVRPVSLPAAPAVSTPPTREEQPMPAAPHPSVWFRTIVPAPPPKRIVGAVTCPAAAAASPEAAPILRVPVLPAFCAIYIVPVEETRPPSEIVRVPVPVPALPT